MPLLPLRTTDGSSNTADGIAAMRRFIDWLAYVAVRVLICIMQAMSTRSCSACALWLAGVVADRLRFARP